jgi:hypothetical protein
LSSLREKRVFQQPVNVRGSPPKSFLHKATRHQEGLGKGNSEPQTAIAFGKTVWALSSDRVIAVLFGALVSCGEHFVSE